MKRFQAFALDIQKAYPEALSRQADPLVAAPDQFARSPPGLVQSPNPRDIAAERLQVFVAVVESGAPQRGGSSSKSPAIAAPPSPAKRRKSFITSPGRSRPSTGRGSPRCNLE